ncbi:ribonuclease J [Clostridium tagluense]|nr:MULTISPECIES: ribonuclease J [Clostridium]MBU3126809.1 ribonuclease J [Clostridium tagluense]MBW9155713.1 ribonuclease J [Clostridium tagluense]MBZ9625529.1 ribonuclease J [Clostridium sp. FP2]MCB2310485.1 ribonuclease J [Clostridium tagluense]MCB2315349.1 ribonuclease J [Clostridium tagluense]
MLNNNYKSKVKNKIRIIPLGGLGEIGKNITAIEYKDEIVVIDCGISFPDADMYGVDLVIPDVTYLLENRDKVKGIFLTHGHEDHIGALPYILKQINVPVYGTRLTLGLVENKLQEHGIMADCTLNVVKPGDIVKLEKLSVEFIRVSHSIADACSIAIHTPIGRIIHTGDFKIDYTPIDGQVIDLERFAKLGGQGVLLLMADSTNVERTGFTISEKVIGESLNKLFQKADGRIIVASFASNIHRIQQIANASISVGRKIAFSGRSMERISQVAMDLGYLHIPQESIITVAEIHNYPDEKVTIVTTGSQGEPLAALTRMASSTHRSIEIQKGDLIIISASPIPGNEKFIYNVINELFKKGANVIYNTTEEIHVSGHACQEELKLIHTLVRPKFFMPVHGEYRHLKQHAQLAEKIGMDPANIFIGETGQILEVSQNECKFAGRVQTGAIMVDGLGVGDVGNIVLRDRKHLAEEGILTVVVTIERESYSILAGPDIITRGFVYMKESNELINEARDIVRKELEQCLNNKIKEWAVIKSCIRNALGQFLYIKTKRRPIIIPIIMEI